MTTVTRMGVVLDALEREYGRPSRLPPLPPIDELILTILSQHTSDLNTARAFQSLRQRFPSWQAVVDASMEEVADAIRSGGLANVKAPRIQQVLRDVHQRLGNFDLGVLGGMNLSEARSWLTSLNGVGAKTASCVLLFALNLPALPVDTHVHRVSLRLGLVPPGTTANRAYQLLEALVPHERTFDAHMLLIRHGRETCVARRPRCERCVLVQWCRSAEVFLHGRSERQEQRGVDDDQAH